MLDLGGALTLPQAVARMQQTLETIAAELRKARTDEPAKRPANRVIPLFLSATGAANQQKKQIAVEAHITGIFLSSDTTGKGTLQIGSWLFPFYVQAFNTAFYRLSEDDQLVSKNDQISWNPPAGSTVWDVVLLVHPR